MKGGKGWRGIAEGAALVMVAGLILAAGWGWSHAVKAQNAYTPTNLLRLGSESVSASSDGLVRLHLKGNSDGLEDQAVKLKVRDAIMERFGDLMTEVSSAEEALGMLAGSIQEVESVASACLEQNGFGYGAKARIEPSSFPDKSYELADGGTLFLPAGKYNALIVDLGEGDGDNWWCVLYPPLCYLDLAQRTVVIGQAPTACPLVIDEEITSDVPVEFRFLVFDALKDGIRRVVNHAWKSENAILKSHLPEYHPTGVMP